MSCGSGPMRHDELVQITEKHGGQTYGKLTLGARVGVHVRAERRGAVEAFFADRTGLFSTTRIDRDQFNTATVDKRQGYFLSERLTMGAASPSSPD